MSKRPSDEPSGVNVRRDINAREVEQAVLAAIDKYPYPHELDPLARLAAVVWPTCGGVPVEMLPGVVRDHLGIKLNTDLPDHLVESAAIKLMDVGELKIVDGKSENLDGKQVIEKVYRRTVSRGGPTEEQDAETKSSKQKRSKRGRPSDTDPKVELAERFEFQPGQVLFDGKDLKVPAGMVTEVLQKLVSQFGRVVPFKELDEQSQEKTAFEQLRKAISRLNNDVLKPRRVPVRIENRKGEGYLILPIKK